MNLSFMAEGALIVDKKNWWHVNASEAKNNNSKQY